MVCILEMIETEIIGWIIATDIDDARRKAEVSGYDEMAQELYRMTLTPGPGKYKLQSGHILLVS